MLFRSGGSSLDSVRKICTDANGNVYVIGANGSCGLPGSNVFFDSDTVVGNGANQLFLVKYTSSGTVSWVRGIGGNNPYNGLCNNFEQAYSLCYDSVSNSLYMTGLIYGTAAFGTINLFGFGTLFLTKVDLNGNFIWAKLYDSGSFTAHASAYISTDLSGNVFLSGVTNDSLYFDSIGIPAGSYWAKLDANGNAIWAKIISIDASASQLFFAENEIYSFFSTKNDSAWIDTAFFTSGTPNNVLFSKFDSIGNIQWHKSFSSSASSSLAGFATIDGSANFYVTGYFQSDIDFGISQLANPNISDFFIAKYDSNGNFIWAKQGNSTNSSGTGSIATTADGSTYICGGYTGNLSLGTFNISSPANGELFIARYDTNGDCLGVLQMGDAGFPYSIDADNSGDVFVAASFDPPNYTLGGITLTNLGVSDIFIAKHDAITGIDGVANKASNRLVIYANPNAGKCIITVPDDFLHEKNLTLRIFDNTGKLIQQKVLEMNNGEIKLNLEAEAKGIYNITLNSAVKSYSGQLVFE